MNNFLRKPHAVTNDEVMMGKLTKSSGRCIVSSQVIHAQTSSLEVKGRFFSVSFISDY